MLKTIAKKIVKRTPLYRAVQSYRHFRGHTYPEFKQYLRLSIEEKYKKQIFKEPAIEVVNLNANDICNSKCTMCNIWEQKQDFEMSPAQLEQVLKDPLFSNVKYVGITGGEPTLRTDLPQLYEAVIKAVPGIKGLSIITNAIKEKEVIERIEQVIAVCKSHQVPFSMMVSVDGYGKVHDRVRGREGNFKTALNVINHFSAKAVPVTIGCTISKVNVWDVDDLLDFLKESNIYGRFRVAEFIKRLYNDDRFDVIRNFDEDETYHLILFFYKLLFTFERDETYRRTYKSIINILAGGNRLIGCPYHSNGVVLNSRAEIAYCAPKSKILGSTLTESGLDLYKTNNDERIRIREEDCDHCIHDYHAPITYNEMMAARTEAYWRKYISLKNKFNFSRHKSVAAVRGSRLQVFITGWYGTETVGDKAILGGIVQQLQEKHGSEFDLVVTSLYPHITVRTLKELAIEARVVNVYSEEFVAYCKGSDLVMMGGGPLMDLDELALPLIAFKLAKAGKGKAIIYGCGLGPLTDEKYRNAVKKMLNLADEIKLRDQKSIALAKEWLLKDTPIELSGDPAKTYLGRYLKTPVAAPKKKIIRCFLRDWTYEYSRNITHAEFLELKKQFELSIANFVKKKAGELGADGIVFEHMHNFIVGNDDRDFSRYFIKTYFSEYAAVPVSYNRYLSTVDSIVNAMQTSVHNVCMRFHSVVFAHTLNTSFTAIDYTRGGKIANYLGDNKVGEHLLSVEDIVKEYHAG